MKIKWKKGGFSLFFSCWKYLIPWWRAKEISKSEFRPSVSRSSSQNITPSLKTLIKKPENEELLREKRE